MKKNCSNCDDLNLHVLCIPVKCIFFITSGRGRLGFVCDNYVNKKIENKKDKIITLVSNIIMTLFYIFSLIGIAYFFIAYMKSGEIKWCFYFLACLILSVWISIENSVWRLKDKIEKGTVKIKKGVR